MSEPFWGTEQTKVAADPQSGKRLYNYQFSHFLTMSNAYRIAEALRLINSHGLREVRLSVHHDTFSIDGVSPLKPSLNVDSGIITVTPEFVHIEAYPHDDPRNTFFAPRLPMMWVAAQYPDAFSDPPVRQAYARMIAYDKKYADVAPFDATGVLNSMADEEIIDLAQSGWRHSGWDAPLLKHLRSRQKEVGVRDLLRSAAFLAEERSMQDSMNDSDLVDEGGARLDISDVSQWTAYILPDHGFSYVEDERPHLLDKVAAAMGRSLDPEVPVTAIVRAPFLSLPEHVNLADILRSMTDDELVGLARDGWSEADDSTFLIERVSRIASIMQDVDNALPMTTQVSLNPEDGLAFVERYRPEILAQVEAAMEQEGQAAQTRRAGPR